MPVALPVLRFGVNFNITPLYFATYFNFCAQEVCPRTAIPLPGIQYAHTSVVFCLSVNREQPLCPQPLYLDFRKRSGIFNARFLCQSQLATKEYGFRECPVGRCQMLL